MCKAKKFDFRAFLAIILFMIDKEPINIAEGVNIYPFKNVGRLQFPQFFKLPYEPPFDALATSPLLKYGQTEGFIEAIAVRNDANQKSPLKDARFTKTFIDSDWVVTEAPIIFVARLRLASVEDYYDLLNYSAKVVLRRKNYYLDLIDPLDCDTDEEIKEFIDEAEELLSFNLHTADSRLSVSEEIVIPGRPSILRRIKFDFVKKVEKAETEKTEIEQPRLFP